MRQNIAQLLAVSFIALITGFVLGLSVGMPMSREGTQTQYAYGSVLIDDQPIALDVHREPMTNRLAIIDGAREHGSADAYNDAYDFAMVVADDMPIDFAIDILQTQQGVELQFIVDEAVAEYIMKKNYGYMIFLNGTEYSTSRDGSPVILPEGWQGSVRVDVTDSRNRLVIGIKGPVQAFTEVLFGD